MAYCARPQIHTSMFPFSIKKPGHSGQPASVFLNTGSLLTISQSKFLKLKKNVGPIRAVSRKAVGIDLGTTNSVVAGTREGQPGPVIIPNTKCQQPKPSDLSTPSVVAYTQNGDFIVGQMAKQQAAVNPDNTFYKLKNYIGKKWCEVDKELEKEVSYRVIAGEDNNNVRLDCPAIGKHFAVEEIQAQVLRKLLNDASKFLREKVTKAVITVPAHFNESQAKATKAAGIIAGLDDVLIMVEPVAVSLAYVSLAYTYEGTKPQILLVFDLGGATCDVTVIEIRGKMIRMLSTFREKYLGGDDFDKRIVDWLVVNFKRDEGIELLEDKQTRLRLTEAAEKVKMELSYVMEANLSLPFIMTTESGPKHIETTLTRAKFEELCADLLSRLESPVQRCIRDAKLSIKDLNGVILVGGSTHIPSVQEHVKKLTRIEPDLTLNPVEVVALGAAVFADQWHPTFQPTLKDKTRLSIGLETLGGVMTKVIPRNTTFPASISEVFSTATDGQTSVKINVLQGEGEFARDNKSLGCFRLDGIPPAPCAIPQIEVKFDIDAKGILTVMAVDKGTGKKQDIIVTDAINPDCLPLDEAETEKTRVGAYAFATCKARKMMDRMMMAEQMLETDEEKESVYRNNQGADEAMPREGVSTPLRGLLV